MYVPIWRPKGIYDAMRVAYGNNNGTFYLDHFQKMNKFLKGNDTLIVRFL